MKQVITIGARTAALILLAAFVSSCSLLPMGSKSSSSSSSSTSNASNQSSSEQSESSSDSSSGKSFLSSDEYHDKGKIKNTFLKDPEYAKMTEDFTRKGSDEFDWGWADPSFNVRNYKTVRVTVKDDFGVLDPDFSKYVKKMFTAAATKLHLRVVGDSAPADLSLGLDIVDYDPNSHYAFVTVVQPQVELEIRLRDLKTGKDLVLIRNMEHDATPKAAVSESARDLIQALR